MNALYLHEGRYLPANLSSKGSIIGLGGRYVAFFFYSQVICQLQLFLFINRDISLLYPQIDSQKKHIWFREIILILIITHADHCI